MMAGSPRRLLRATCVFMSMLVNSVLAQDLDPIVIKGSKFFYKTNGTQFYVKGIAYQQDFASDSSSSSGGDPLADPAGCERDIPYLTQLHTNTIRVYAVDPTKDHSECMRMLADAGIYVLADLGSPNVSINSIDPSWNTDIYARYTAVVDALVNYTNVLGFFAGNEIVTQPNETNASPFAKAAVRDMKAYIKSQNYRHIGVGYATSDNQYIREQLADYMNCGSDQDNAVDFWGYNVYSWCGESNFNASGYSERVQEFESYSVPVFFAEYGCIDPKPRIFQETPVLYGPEMNEVFSGGIVYLYFQDAKGYGLIDLNDDAVTTLADFTNLASQIATISPTGVNSASYNPTNSPQACPTPQVNFTVGADLPPTPDPNLCTCMFSSLTCLPAASLDPESYGDLFSYVCSASTESCAGIAANGTTGTYGPYGMCTDLQKLGYVLDQYYNANDRRDSACAFSGSAELASATPSVAESCSAVLNLASSSAAGVASSSTGAAAMRTVGRMSGGLGWVGTVGLVLFVNVAVWSAVGMVLL